MIGSVWLMLLIGLVGLVGVFICAFLMIIGFIVGFSSFISGNAVSIIMFFESIAAFVLFGSQCFLTFIIF